MAANTPRDFARDVFAQGAGFYDGPIGRRVAREIDAGAVGETKCAARAIDHTFAPDRAAPYELANGQRVEKFVGDEKKRRFVWDVEKTFAKDGIVDSQTAALFVAQG